MVLMPWEGSGAVGQDGGFCKVKQTAVSWLCRACGNDECLGTAQELLGGFHHPAQADLGVFVVLIFLVSFCLFVGEGIVVVFI